MMACLPVLCKLQCHFNNRVCYFCKFPIYQMV